MSRELSGCSVLYIGHGGSRQGPLREDGGMVVAGADGTAILTWLLVLLAGSVKPA